MEDSKITISNSYRASALSIQMKNWLRRWAYKSYPREENSSMVLRQGCQRWRGQMLFFCRKYRRLVSSRDFYRWSYQEYRLTRPYVNLADGKRFWHAWPWCQCRKYSSSPASIRHPRFLSMLEMFVVLKTFVVCLIMHRDSKGDPPARKPKDLLVADEGLNCREMEAWFDGWCCWCSRNRWFHGKTL